MLEKACFIGIFGAIGGAVLAELGGFDAALKALLIFMAADYLSGLVLAGVFKKSKKSASGGLSSWAGLKGLAKKVMSLVIVLVANQLDALAGSEIVRDGAVVALIANEGISLLENAGLMGAPLPGVVTKAIDALNNKGGKKGE